MTFAPSRPDAAKAHARLDDLICPFCGDFGLRIKSATSIVSGVDVINCLNCDGRHDMIGSAPYPGGFTAADFPTLAAMVLDRTGEATKSLSFLRSINGAFGRALATGDSVTALSNLDDDIDPVFLQTNFQRWRHFNAMLGGGVLQGASVLAIASGLGLDAVRLIDVGADATFLESSPISLAARQRLDPEVRWIGGLPHRIPFDDETFDLVCFDGHAGAPGAAALQDIVRTLKVGGRLFISGMALAASGASGDCAENLPTFATIQEALRAIPVASLQALITDTAALDRLTGTSALDANFTDSWLPAWEENVAVLREVPSVTSVVVTRIAGEAPSFKTISPLSIRPGMAAAWAEDVANGAERLMVWAPESLTGFEPRSPIFSERYRSNDRTVACWFEDVDIALPSPGFAISCDAVDGLEVVVNGRTERLVSLGGDGRGSFVLSRRSVSGHVLIELRIPSLAVVDRARRLTVSVECLSSSR